MNNLDYGIVGNGLSAALISKKGSIDWLCLPHFNSSSVFAKILDKQIGGSFEILVDEDYEISQKYQHNTNILITSFKKGNDHFELADFMPRYYLEGTKYCPPDLIRYFKYVSGKPCFKIIYNPKLEYAKYFDKTEIQYDYIKTNTRHGVYDSLYLYSSLNKKAIIQGETFQLTKDEFLLISYNQKLLEQTVERSYLKLQRTKVYWMNWVDSLKKYEKYSQIIIRSALTLKLLSYEKTGAILAAVTTSIPETLGEIRNWDYRFCWLRDASMVVDVLSKLGRNTVAIKYLDFIINIIPDKDEKIQIMYGIDGEKKLEEKILDHLEGYENSMPVRIGNAAYKQKQNDIYGILMDAIYQQFMLFHTSLQQGEDLWTITRNVVKVVSKNWKKPDRGIWEIRGDEKHFTFSKVLCWVAVDRGIKIARLLKKNEYFKPWQKLCELIKEDVIKHAWSEEIKSFTQCYGANDLDASTLLMEKYGFIKAKDPKYIQTVKAIKKNLLHKGLMYRYKNADDFGIPSSSFTICTFWLINSLFAIGQKKEAVTLFEKLLTYSNHLGLFSEDIDFETKRLLGNFPQAYSHLALIDTAIMLSGYSKTKEGKILEAINA